MRKIFAVGVVFLLALLIIGLTWIAPMANRDKPDGGTASSSGGVTDYRVDEPNGTVVNVDLVAQETTQEIADGVTYHVWTFNGTTPAPVIRVHLGDTIHFTLTNKSSIGMQHSIDFHAAMTAWADLPAAGQTTLEGNYQPVDPGKTKTFDWVAMFPGVFMYHCGVPPVLQHISNGMYGAIIVEPDGLPVEREFVLVSSELYPGNKPIDGVFEGDLDRMLAVDPEYVVFNGKANQYVAAPLEVIARRAVPHLGLERRTDPHQRVPRDRNHVHGNPCRREPGEHPIRIADVLHSSGGRRDVRAPDPGRGPVPVRDALVRLHRSRGRRADQGGSERACGTRLVSDDGRSVLGGDDGVHGWRSGAEPKPDTEPKPHADNGTQLDPEPFGRRRYRRS